MSARLTLLLWLGAWLLSAAAAEAAVYTINSDRDSFIREDSASQNNGTVTQLDVRANGSGINRRAALYGFTLPAIPAGEIITSAVLRVFVRRADTVPVTVHRVTDSWTEAGVTWANTGTDFDAASLGSFTPSTNDVYISVNITALVSGWRAGTITNHGVTLRPGTSADSRFTAREWATANERPELVVTTGPALTMVKSSQPYFDPYNGTINPKLIPGAFASYTVTVANTGSYTVTNDSVVITDPTPAGLRLFVGDVPGGSGPVLFTAGGSGLAYTYGGLASTTDDVDFSNNGGSTWTYAPTPNVDQVDPNVTHVRIRPKGTMAAASSFSLLFGYQVQ